jgi:predicted metal-dependent enzyme (double-stranded beta helix superfamily)
MPTKTRTPVNASQIALRLAANHSLWQGLVQYDADARYYTRLAAEPGYEAWLLSWLPGQGTEWHDHGGSAGAFVVLQGILTEERAVVRPDGPPRIEPSAQQYAYEALRPFGSKHIHRVTNQGPRPAVSLHVYSPGLHEMNYYEASNGLLLQTGSSFAGVNW